MHHAAAWGKLGVLKALVEAQSDLQQKNVHGERARETALRYNKTECVDFLDWAGMYILYPLSTGGIVIRGEDWDTIVILNHVNCFIIFDIWLSQVMFCGSKTLMCGVFFYQSKPNLHNRYKLDE